MQRPQAHRHLVIMSRAHRCVFGTHGLTTVGRTRVHRLVAEPQGHTANSWQASTLLPLRAAAMASPQLTPESGDAALKIPPPTVREATTFGAFTEATLVGGSQGLDRQIEWVRVMETPDTPRRLRQGELLLTTCFPVKDDTAAQILLVDTVSRSGGSGVVVKLGRYIDDVPPEMIEEAERLALPLFTI